MRTAIMAFVFVLLATPADAQETQQFSWNGRLAAGKVLDIQGTNGDIRAEPGTGDQVEISATKRGRRSDPEEVRIEVITHADGVTLCAVYPGARNGRSNECRPGGGGHSNVRNNDVTVSWVVKVPTGVRFEGRTVNGDVSAEGLRADADVHTVNGSVRVSTTGYAHATTVNGSVQASFGRADWTEPLRISTVNGGITLNLPASLSADVRAETVNGDIESDFPLTITGRINRRRISGTIGDGGRTMHLSTVNGSIRLVRSS